MAVELERIKQALYTIQQTCKEAVTCNSCPLGLYGECQITARRMTGIGDYKSKPSSWRVASEIHLFLPKEKDADS